MILSRRFPAFLVLLTLAVLLSACETSTPAEKNDSPADSGQLTHPNQWTTAKANAWYADRPWPVGTNFGPSTAINQLEMWQEDTFDPETIDRELGWSADLGMNLHRVFLHDLLWEQDSAGFLDRIDQYLAISDRHGIKTMLVLFDGVWDPQPELGPQPDPVPRKHNSGWVQSPGAAALADTSSYPRLERYLKGVMGHFRNDDRVLVWDIFNEPQNTNGGSYPDTELPDKEERAFALLQAAFGWAREVNPSQPTTAGAWGGFIGSDGLHTDNVDAISQFMLDNSDVITFHTYETPDAPPHQIDYLETYNRPIICTEYLARGHGNNFENLLPLFESRKVGALNWGFVSGKTNTIYPWNSWDSTYVAEPEPWHHDILREDGTPFRESEVTLFRELTGK